MTAPDAVYADPDGFHYVACFDDEDGDGAWFRWPAIEHGWTQRRRCSEAAADACDELPAVLADLALRLSGAPWGGGVAEGPHGRDFA
jgi:hypothetical protein